MAAPNNAVAAECRCELPCDCGLETNQQAVIDGLRRRVRELTAENHRLHEALKTKRTGW